MSDTAQVAYHYEFVVVGAGPAGLATATMLAQQGSKVALFESRPRPDNVFGSYPVVINARGMAALETMGPAVVDKIQAAGMPVTQLHIVPDNKTVAKVNTWGTGIMRDQTAGVLLEAGELLKNLDIFWEHKFTSIDFSKHSLTFKKPDDSEVSYTGARVVSADGNRSQIRVACEQEIEDFSAEAEPWGFSLRFMNSKGKPEQTEINKDYHYVLGEKGYVCQQPDGQWSFALRVLPESDEDFLTADEATDERVQQLKEYCEKHAAAFARNLLDDEAYRGFYSCRAFDGLVVKLSTLAPLDWLCFVGDSSHAVQPATGEGINSGLEDAAVLARCVRTFRDAAFYEFDAEHRANAHALNLIALDAREQVVGATPRKKSHESYDNYRP
jgi:kynurenine 3-monooxygenase